MSADFKKAENEALKVIKDNFITVPPVLSEALARNYGLTVQYYTFKPEYTNVSGFITKNTIIVNVADSPNRRNFTIAHELGHYLLGHADKPDYEVLYRRPIADTSNKPMEQEANCFAANLLVPKQMLQKYISDYPFINNEQLARIFGVSSDVIGFRRQILGV
ncbi:MAG: ImmA/IrrE family metallo-endopeptidase [Elusimicrobia bacterium]|nr:ImmA/IrrE family metallo-endopeptidase [Elusimicrobiota bacterium]